MNGIGKELVEEWSNQRNSIFVINGQEIPNTNVKVYNEKQVISTKDWTDAYKWNAQGHKIIQVYSTKNIYCTSDHLKIITKEQCRKYLQDINLNVYTDFDNMMQQVEEFRVIKINEHIWENSECSCKEWHKFLKCNHVIALATRLKLCTFSKMFGEQSRDKDFYLK